MLSPYSCIQAVLSGLAAAHLFKDAVIKQGQVPNMLLLQLKQGPGKHIKAHAYQYQRKIDLELGRIRRVKDLQVRMVGLVATGIAAVAIGVSNFFSRLVYESVHQRGGENGSLGTM